MYILSDELNFDDLNGIILMNTKHNKLNIGIK